ncbi:MAG: L-histidine N(alpha)-methyltransferase [Candidatus Eremiobacteraeota bacterium]|nr:L-histidine N(alpha)-methyltransferase [Candidatus Eremiobacteraeota bacterium]
MNPTLTIVSDRLEIVSSPQPSHAASSSFADDVRTGLTAPAKSLWSKYFYDELGSALFEAITVLPEYYLTRAETEILREWGWEIVRALGNPIEFLELGSGSAVKTRILIEEALRVQGTLRYCPVDISPEALRASALALVDAYPALRVTAYAADYFTILGSDQLRFQNRVLAMFIGSNIGNYQPHEAANLLQSLAVSLRAGDGLLIGADLKKDRQTLELAYNDPTGVTAAFDKNVLARINRELGGRFDPRDFEHLAVYDEDRGVINSFLIARRAHEVRIDALNLSVEFARGERIHTESSYKFSVEDIARIGAAAGFHLQRSWFDSAQRFSVNLLVRDRSFNSAK